jgi:hypothetical protein
MKPERIQELRDKIVGLRDSDIGPQAQRNAALLNGEVALDFILELGGLSQILHQSTDRILESNKISSESSNNLARSLVRATWG